MARAPRTPKADPAPAVEYKGADSPASVSEVITNQEPVWDTIDDLLAGTRRLREKAGLYMPQHPGEKEGNWNRRVRRGRLFPAYRETIEGCTGLVFRRPPVLDIADTSKSIRDDAENLDGMGNAFHVFAKRLFWNGVAKGWHGIFVDYPSVGDNPAKRSKAAEKGLRPYWSLINGRQVRNFEHETTAGKEHTVHLTLLVDVRRRTGRFGEVKTCELREYTLTGQGVEWMIWEAKDEKGEKWQPTGRFGTMTGVKRIPFTPFYAGRVIEQFWAEPPLEELAHTNLQHYCLDANYETGLEMALGPILEVKGRSDPKTPLVIGPYASIDVDATGGVAYREHTGAAFGSARQRIEDYKAEEAAMGLAMLQRETRAAETAEAKRIDEAVQHSKLGSAAIGLQDALEMAMLDHAQFRGVQPGKVRVNLDFENLSLSPDQIRTYMEMVSTNKLSLQTMWKILREGRALPEDFDPDKEMAAIADELERTGLPLTEGGPGGDDEDLDAA